MVHSMTGYGMGVCSTDKYKVTVELKSLNSKYFELGLKVPRAYMKYENQLRTQLTKELERGKISMLLNIEHLTTTRKSSAINQEALIAYIEELKLIQHAHNLQPISLEHLLTLPNVLNEEATEGDEDEWKALLEATLMASKALVKNRIEEGKSITADFNERVSLIEKALAEIEILAPGRLDAIRLKMKTQLDELRNQVELHENRFEQELIFYIERLDINEEIVRLRQHITFFRDTLKDKTSNGKTLNFISQEMGREINTIGSKANDAKIQRLVVGMKDELEKIKEQTSNIV